jgi:serine/threonine-protein kinase
LSSWIVRQLSYVEQLSAEKKDRVKVRFNFRNIAIAQLVLWLIALLQQLLYWQRLPERVATHFDGSGKPNGWMHRDNAALLMVGFETLMPAIFLGIAYAIYFIPSQFINIPHREFWLAPDKREASIAFVARSTAAFSLAISLFFIGMNHLTYLANQSGGNLNPLWFWTLMACFLVFTALWVLGLMLRFRIPATR